MLLLLVTLLLSLIHLLMRPGNELCVHSDAFPGETECAPMRQPLVYRTCQLGQSISPTGPCSLQLSSTTS